MKENSIKILSKKIIKNTKPVKGGNGKDKNWILFYDEADALF